MTDNINYKTDYKNEEMHLKECLDIINKNVAQYEKKLTETKAEVKELYDNYRSNNPELHSELVMGLDWQSQLERTVNKNKSAQDKPYFGRIDYSEQEDGKERNFKLYIGKNGVAKNVSDVLIVDWRAPISSVYYESDIGAASYPSPEGDMINVSLQLKRTYEIDKGKLIDYYDTDVISNDEFLTKYLAKNKEVILGEIIATIQKEQNTIIRDTPWHTVIVQGVAGSGKTTVAMHRISYLLYNYKDKLRQDEFYIIGSNKTLLNYIVSVLPNLDVYNAHQLTMTELLLYLLDDSIKIKKQKFKIQDILREDNKEGFKQLKGSIDIVSNIEDFLKNYVKQGIPVEDVIYNGEVIYSSEDIEHLIDSFSMYSMQEKIDVLNKKLINKIMNINEKKQEEKDYIKNEVKKHKNYFGKAKAKIDIFEVYKIFLKHLKFMSENNQQEAAIKYILERLDEKYLDLYDLSLLCLIKKRLINKNDFNLISHVVVDEAQDFGASVFMVLKSLFTNCNFTIMGDISQNIYYDSGMNDWKTLRERVFNENKDKFYTLSKSYRNTVEISTFASRILKKCTFETYEIDPVIRHGKEVLITKTDTNEQMYAYCVKTLNKWKADGYDTMAIICCDMEEALLVQEALAFAVEINKLPNKIDEVKFVNGIMVLPIHLTKGLEFDTVLIFNPSNINYPYNNSSAKLLYVAVTRALHELEIIYREEISGLLL